jgi:phosphoenolpyruvate-protein kinase (PTS system EI component)
VGGVITPSTLTREPITRGAGGATLVVRGSHDGDAYGVSRASVEQKMRTLASAGQATRSHLAADAGRRSGTTLQDAQEIWQHHRALAHKRAVLASRDLEGLRILRETITGERPADTRCSHDP